MPNLQPVSYDPFAASGEPARVASRPTLTPVDHDPFAGATAPASSADAPRVARKPAGVGEAFVRGFRRSLPETKMLAGGALAAAGGLVGADGVRDYGLEVYQRGKEQSAPDQGPSFADVRHGDAGIGEYVGDVVGNFAGQGAQSLVAAGAGALAGSELPGAGTAAGAVGGLVARGAVKKAIAGEAEKLIAKRVTAGATREAAEAAAGAATRKTLQRIGGGTAGAIAHNTALEVGTAYGGRADDAAAAGENLTQGDAARAFAFGVPAGFIDTAAEAVGAGRIFRGASASPRIAKRVMAGIAQGAAVEGATEGTQAVLERAGAGQSLTDEAARDDYLENFVAGAVGGGVLGAPGGVRRRVAPRPKVTPAGPITQSASPEPLGVEEPVAKRHPAAAPGSISDAANYVPAAGSSSATNQGVVDNTEARAPAAAAAPATPRPGIGALPWIDQATGEASEPTDMQVKAVMHDHMNRLAESGIGINKRFLFDALRAGGDNLPAGRLNNLFSDVQGERRRGLTAPLPPRADAIAQLRAAAEPATEADVRALGAAPTVGPRDAVRLYAELLGTEQGAANAPIAAIPAGADGRRDTLSVLHAAQEALRERQSPKPTNMARLDDMAHAWENEQFDNMGTTEVAGLVSGFFGENIAKVTPSQAARMTGVPLEKVEAAWGAILQRASSPASTDADGTVARLGADGVRTLQAEGKAPAPTLSPAAAPTPAAQVGEPRVDAPAAADAPIREGQQAVPSAPPASGSQAAATTAVDAGRSESGAVPGQVPSAQDTPAATAVHAAAHEAATSPLNDRPEPTEAQKEAGNFKVGRLKINGLDISIEHPAGVKRKAEHSKALAHAYGYIRRTEGNDGEHVDVFLGDRAADTSLPVYVVDQVKPDGSFDEHKALMGFGSEKDARAAYLANYPKRWKGLGGIRQMSQDEFKAWVSDPANTKAPAASSDPGAAAQAVPASPQPAPSTAPAAMAPEAQAAQAPKPAPVAEPTGTAAAASTASPRSAPASGTGRRGETSEAAASSPSVEDTPAARITPKVRRVGGRPVFVPRARETLEAYFQPGREVPSYGGTDRVLEFDWNDGQWRVKVQGLTFNNRSVEGDAPRWHSTMPSPKDLKQVFGDPAQYAGAREKRPTKGELVAAAAPRQETAGALFSKAPPAPFRQQVAERLKTLEDRGAMLDLGRSPAVLRMLKLPDLPLRMPANVLFKVAAGKGGTRAALTEQQIAKLPELIDDPVAVFRDPQRPDNVIVLTSLVDAEGLPVQVAIRQNGLDGREPANIVLSAFGRVNAADWVRRAQLLYRGEKVNPQLPQSNLDQRQAEGDAGGSAEKVLGPADLRNFRAQARGSAFSKAETAPARRRTPGRVDRARAQQLIAELTKNWGDNAPSIRLVESAAELPANIASDPDAERIEGVYAGGRVVWLNLGRIRSEQRFAEVLAHEAIGHYGVERVVGKDVWERIVRAIEQLDRSGKASRQLREIFADIRARQPAAAADREAFAKEAIAFMAERGIRNGWVNRVVNAVRRWLRKVLPSMRWREIDVRGLLSDAEGFLRRKSTPSQQRALVQRYAFQLQASPFYSALTRSVDTAVGAPRKGDAKAWAGWLDGAQRRGEFRQAERDWLGVDAWLASQKGPVTREALADFIRANQVQVQDVVLDDKAAEATVSNALNSWIGDHVELDSPGAKVDYASIADELNEYADDYAQDGNAREEARYRAMANEARALATGRQALPTKYSEHTLPGGGNYRELLLALPARGNTGVDFKSGHFDQLNILAHVRFNERTDADGKRVLFLEEVQSDWHQEGRREGYDTAVEYAVYDKNDTSLPVGWGYRTEAEASAAHPGERFEVVPTTTGSGVPDAPFKGTDDWAMLAVKRMVRWAADHGFDRIAWTTGQQQTERYKLSKHVSQVNYVKGGLLLVYDRGGSLIYNQKTAPAKVADVIGREAAERLLAAPVVTRDSAQMQVIEGSGLEVGGAGMRAFYDKILPAAVGKWAKRLGGTVGTTRIAVDGEFNLDLDAKDPSAEQVTQAVHSLDITPQMRDAALAGQPLFSKAPADVLDDLTAVMDANQPSNLVDRARAALKDMVPKKLKDQMRTTWLGALTTRHLTELGTDYMDQMRYYSDYLAEMGADRNQLQQESEGVAERARKWASKHQAQARQLFDLMHEATIEGVDPAEGYQPLQFRYGGKMHEATPKNIKDALAAIRDQMRGRGADNKTDMLQEAKTLRGMPAREKRRRAQYPGLVARWNQLSPEAKEIYREFRDSYKDRSDAIEKALIARINDADVPQGHKDKIIAVIRSQFESQRLQGVYFPLQRFGRYFVAAERGETPVFLMFERLTELEGAVKDLRARGFKINAQGLKSAGKAQDAPSGTFVGEIIMALQKGGVSEKMQDEIYQLYLQTLPELSMRKHAIHRQAVPGFDPDAVRAFAFNMHHGAHQLARLRYAHKLQAVLTMLQQHQDALRKEDGADTRKIAAADAILGELARRHEWIMNPTDNQVTSLVSSFGFIYYLGLTPAASLVNLTQTALVSFPYLASRHGGIKAMNALLSGMSASIRTGGHLQRTLTDPDELRLHAYLQKAGALDKTQAHNLAGIAEGGLSGYNPAWARAMEIIGWGFHKTEVVNREATGIAAFRLARAAGDSFENAAQAAVDAINDTHFDYTNQNRARFMQSGTAKVLLMFRQYSLNMTWHLGRMVWQATKGESPEVRRIARRNLTGILGMSALFSGVLGLPLMSVTMGVLNSIAASFGDDDEPWDAETEFRAFLSDMLGPSVASVVLGGAVNPVTGADVASRVSLSQLWFRDADRELEGEGAYYNLLEQAAGPMGGVLKNALVGKALMDEGHLYRGFETMLPKALKDTLKSARYASEGVNNLRGDPLVPDANVRDTLLQLAGFTPWKVADQYDRNRALKGYEQQLLERRTRLMDAYAMAQRLGDTEATREVLASIQRFNRTNPTIAITAKSIRASLRQRARYSARAEGGITLDKRLARRVREAVGEG